MGRSLHHRVLVGCHGRRRFVTSTHRMNGSVPPTTTTPPGPVATPRSITRALVVPSLVGLAMGAMLGGSALGVVYAASMPVHDTPLATAPGGPSMPPVMLTVPDEADEESPLDDDDPLLAPLDLPTAQGGSASGGGARRNRGPNRNALDSAFYRVQPGPVTGYRDGRAFSCTVTLVDGKPVEVRTAAAFERMRAAASRAGIAVRSVRGFRTMDHQRALYAACRAGRGNLAALPGFSNHQSGHALDLNVTGPGVLRWLERHARDFGFRRTVPTETWHWEWW
jgi:hypothetical protein